MTEAALAPTGEAAAAPAAESGSTRPFSAFEWMIGLRYLRGRRARAPVSAFAGFAFVGILLGVWAIIVVMSVMNGFHIELMNKIIGINGHVFLQAAETPLSDYEEVTERVSKVPGVTLAIPMVESAAGVSSQVHQSGALVRGIKEDDLRRLPGISANVIAGSLDAFDGLGGVAIGKRMAESLGVTIGDTISIMTARGDATPFGMAPRMKAYQVVAIFQIGVTEFDNIFVYMPIDEAMAFFNKDGEASVIEAFVDNPDDMDHMRQRLQAAVQRPMILTDWRQRNRSFFEALKIERTVMFLILTLIVLVASLNIITGMTMLVKDKGRDIAILRTMGATRGAIMRVFLITGSTIGVAGTVGGVIIGLLMARNLEGMRQAINRVFGINAFDPNFYLLSRLPSVVVPSDIVTVATLSLVLTLLATIYPSWRAAKLDPVEALRYE